MPADMSIDVARTAGTPVAGPMNPAPAIDWRTIGALNAVSTLAQIGQFGIAFVVLPLWLAAQGLDASQLGLFAASLWFGQLPGLAMAPWLCRRIGSRWVVAAGLLCTLLALALIAGAAWPAALAGGALAGFGLGLRWIGLEPWLYRIAPAGARGRLVGFHETLIALAPIIAPLLAGRFGVRGPAVFWIGAGFTVLAMLPLAWAHDVAATAPQPLATAASGLRAAWREGVFRQGVAIALIGGMIDAAVAGLFAPFALWRGVSDSQTADLLAVFGVGGLVMQYGVGWLADRRGVGSAAIACSVGAAIVALVLVLPLALPLLLPLRAPIVVAAVFLLGGFVTAFLTLAIVAGTLTAAGSIARNVSAVSMLYTAGGGVGPLGAGMVMKAWQPDALMWLIAAAATVLAGVLVVGAVDSARSPSGRGLG